MYSIFSEPQLLKGMFLLFQQSVFMIYKTYKNVTFFKGKK